MRLIEYEQTIKNLIKEDIKNPKIYNLLQEMIYMFLQRKKVGRTSQEIKEVSYTFAGDIYMKLLSGDNISHFLGYFEKKYKEYFKEYYSSNRFTEPYDPFYDYIKDENTSANFVEFDRALSKIYLNNINKVIDKIFEGCKYLYNSPEYINLKLSLALSLVREEITPFHLNDEHTPYLKLLVVLFYNEVKSTLGQEEVLV